MIPYDVLVQAEHRLLELVEPLDRADLARPSPCAGWDVRALLSHTLAGLEVFASTVDGEPAPTAEEMFGGGDRIGDDPVGATMRATRRSQAAWASRPDPDRVVDTILGSLPAGQVMAISAFATVVHGWDIAVATGRPLTEVPAELLAHAATVAAQFVPDLRAGDDHSLFAPALATAAGCTSTQRLMAYLGRDAAPA